MAENVELDDSVKAELLDLEAKIGAVDHFTLLGVPKEAPAGEVKKAFFKLCRRIHPDRYFRKKLGSFKGRIDLVFKALSKAHQILTDPEQREAYLKATPEARRPPPPKPVPKRKRGERMEWKKDDLPDLAALLGKKDK